MVIKRNKPPREWQDPKKYKPYLRRCFAYTCAYGWVHESWLGGAPEFEVEHFRPEGRPEFAHLRSAYANLYYVWGPCNRAKGSSWPSSEEQAAGFRFVDPCVDVAFEHLGYEIQAGCFTGRLVGLTPAGRYTIEKCDLNNGVLREVRRRIAKEFREARKSLTRINFVLGDETLSLEQRRALEAEVRATQNRISAILNPRPLPPDDQSSDVNRTQVTK